jgi:hypothetical protein
MLGHIAAGEDFCLALGADALSATCRQPELFFGKLGPIPLASDGAGWGAVVPGAETAKMPPGRPRLEVWADVCGLRVRAWIGSVQVTPSLAAGHDGRTHEEKVLAALKDALLRLATDDEAEVSIHDRTVKFKDPERVQAMIDIYQGKVDAQRSGGSAIRTIPLRLRR